MPCSGDCDTIQESTYPFLREIERCSSYEFYARRAAITLVESVVVMSEPARRFPARRKAGIPVRRLLLRNVDHVIDLDLLLDHGVSAPATPAVEQAAGAPRLIEPPSRFGLWHRHEATIVTLLSTGRVRTVGS
jgi:hypothetical protein